MLVLGHVILAHKNAHLPNIDLRPAFPLKTHILRMLALLWFNRLDDSQISRFPG
jgi:hypothetical protein